MTVLTYRSPLTPGQHRPKSRISSPPPSSPGLESLTSSGDVVNELLPAAVHVPCVLRN